MTDQNMFTQDQGGQDQNTKTGFQNADQGSAGQEGADTHSPEYQIQMMQKRMSDKDEFISQLQEENQKTREMYASLEERMQNLSKIEEVLNNQNTAQDVGNQDTTGLDEDALVGKVIENLNQKQTEEKMKANFEQAKQRLASEYGSHVEEKVSQAAQANGMAYDDMVQMARKSPQAFYKLMGLESNTQQRPATPNPMRGHETPPQDNNEKDFAYYSKLMRENPREYWKPEVQREFRKLFTKKKETN